MQSSQKIPVCLFYNMVHKTRARQKWPKNSNEGWVLSRGKFQSAMREQKMVHQRQLQYFTHSTLKLCKAKKEWKKERYAHTSIQLSGMPAWTCCSGRLQVDNTTWVWGQDRRIPARAAQRRGPGWERSCPNTRCLYCPSHMQPAHQQFPVRVLFCLTFFFALPKAGWVELLLMALLFITLSVVIFLHKHE